MKVSAGKSIDDEQPQTVESHFDAIMADVTLVDSNYKKVTVDDLPHWFDEELFKRGQSFYCRNILSAILGNVIGLIAVYLVPTIAEVLISTRQSSTSCLAYKRYLRTLLHVVQLHKYDIKDSNSRFYKSLNTIRWQHSTYNKRSQKNKNTGFLQRNLVVSQFGFVGYALLKYEELGFTNEIADRQAYNHFWRVMGHLLGIPDRLNLCRKNEFETTLLCEKIMTEISNKLKDPAPGFYYLTDKAIEGFWAIDVTLDRDAFYKFFFEIHECEYSKELNLYSKLMYLYKKSIIASFGVPVLGYFSRIGWNTHVRMSSWIAENFPFIAWIKYGKIQSKIHLYPHSEI